MFHDREVMDREIPDHVHVALEQPEVHPRGVVVVDVADLAGSDQAGDGLDRAGVDEGMIDHQDALRRAASSTSRAEVAGESVIGFSTSTCFAGAQRRSRDLEMRVDRRRHHHRVDGGVGDKIAPVRHDARARMPPRRTPLRGRRHVGDHLDPERVLLETARVRFGPQ